MPGFRIVFAACLLLPGCVLNTKTFNEPLITSDIAGLRPGSTTAREVVELLGAPRSVVQLGYRSAYLYEHEVAKEAAITLLIFNARNEDTRTDRLWAFFDEQGLLTHVGVTLASGRARWQMPWQDFKTDDP